MLRSKSKLRTQYPLPPISMLGSNRACQLAKLIPGTRPLFNVILKARQLGISTITAGYIVWLMLFHRDKAILVMATKFATAGNLVKKVKGIMRNVPDWLSIATITVDNRTSFELSNGSSIKAASTSGDAGRSEALSLLVLDEAAHIEGLDELCRAESRDWGGLWLRG